MIGLGPALLAEEDAYGRSIWAYYNNNRSYEIIERDDGYFDVSSGASTYLAPYDKWVPHEQSAMNFAQGHVIDIGCGAGRHALYLQDHGYDMLGIDISYGTCPKEEYAHWFKLLFFEKVVTGISIGAPYDDTIEEILMVIQWLLDKIAWLLLILIFLGPIALLVAIIGAGYFPNLAGFIAYIISVGNVDFTFPILSGNREIVL